MRRENDAPQAHRQTIAVRQFNTLRADGQSGPFGDMQKLAMQESRR
jgi:hypothetical protein